MAYADDYRYAPRSLCDCKLKITMWNDSRKEENGPKKELSAQGDTPARSILIRVL